MPDPSSPLPHAAHGSHSHEEGHAHPHAEEGHDDDHDHEAHAGHEHGHAHGEHGHSHVPTDFGRAFLIGIVLNASFVGIEVVYGLMSHSLSLVADAGHNLGDVAGLALAWVAGVLSKRFPTARHTYGLRRSSVLAALANAIILMVTIGAIGWEAIIRLAHPQPVEGMTVIVVAAIGILVNGATALLFMSGRKGDINVRAAFMHMASDAAISLGVVIAGGAMLATGWLWIDPVVSLIIAALILLGTWGLLRDSINLALDAVPAGVDALAVKKYLQQAPGVTAVHDFHIWGMSTTETALTAHLVIPAVASHDGFHAHLGADLKRLFGISHVTIQIETGDPSHPCSLEPDSVV